MCQFLHHPTTIRLEAAQRVLRYVKGTLHQGIFLSPGPLSLSAFIAADWAGDPCDRKSIAGFIVFLESNPISWSSKKQTTVSRSSLEAEYRALATIAAEMHWLRTLFKDLHLPLPYIPTLWCDNASAIALNSYPVFHARTKHIEVNFHFIRERYFTRIFVSALFLERIIFLIFSLSLLEHLISSFFAAN